jgi:hypothetical protein
VFHQKLTYDSTGQITKQVWKHAGSAQQNQLYTSPFVGWKNNVGDSTFYLYDRSGNQNVAALSHFSPLHRTVIQTDAGLQTCLVALVMLCPSCNNGLWMRC